MTAALRSRPWSGPRKIGPGDVEHFRFRLLTAKQQTAAVDTAAATRSAGPVATPEHVGPQALGIDTQQAAFVEVPTATQPPAVVDAAAAAVRLCATLLDLEGTPRIRWFTPDGGDQPAAAVRFAAFANLGGKAEPDRSEVWLLAGRDVAETMATAAHECRHLAQPDHRRAADPVAAWHANELDARNFTDGFIAAYLPDHRSR